MEKSWKVEITTEELCHFFSVRSPGFAGTLAAGEFPAALESFAPCPCQILAGNIPVVRHERDADWEGNLYEVYQLPVDSTGCLLERHSVSSVWRFRGIGGDLWEVESPERWRVLNAFAGEQLGMANSQFGRHAPSLREAAAALGRKGGSARSEAKTAAVRENGRKGGRPKKTE
jgi:hypothetical protein